MTDEEYLFHATARERKDVARSARHKKRQGGRHVRLPSDHRTKKELAAMNGEVKTYKEKPFYSREEFLALPEDLRLGWVNSIINRYAVGISGMSKIVFGERHFAERNVPNEYVNKGPRGRGASEGLRKLQADFDEYRAPQAEEQADAEQPDIEPNGYAIRDALADMAREEIAKIDAVRLAALLQSLSGTGAKLTIEVTL